MNMWMLLLILNLNLQEMLMGNDRILSASSILDYVFRELAISYLGKEELAHTPSIASTKDILMTSDR